MSKHAVISFSDALRREMNKWGVKVSTIEPTAFKTTMTSESYLNQLMDKKWKETTDSVRNAYGLKYFESQKNIIFDVLKYIKPGDKDIVVNDILDAIINVRPKISYQPSDGIISRFAVLIPLYFSNQWIDKLQGFIDRSKPDLSVH